MPNLTAIQRKAISNAKNAIIAKDLGVTVAALTKAKIHASKSTDTLQEKYENMNEKKADVKKTPAKPKATKKPAKKSPAKSKAKKK